MKIALLSNVNMNFVIRMLQNQSREQSTAVAENGEEGLRELSIYNAPGYGNELGLLLDPTSSYQEFGPDITFLVMDVMELLEHDLTVEESRVFHVERCPEAGKDVLYIGRLGAGRGAFGMF